jgi:hypothetical protein
MVGGRWSCMNVARCPGMGLDDTTEMEHGSTDCAPSTTRQSQMCTLAASLQIACSLAARWGPWRAQRLSWITAEREKQHGQDVDSPRWRGELQRRNQLWLNQRLRRAQPLLETSTQRRTRDDQPASLLAQSLLSRCRRRANAVLAGRPLLRRLVRHGQHCQKGLQAGQGGLPCRPQSRA